MRFRKDKQFYKFSLYGFFKNLKFYDPFLLLFFVESGISYSEIGVLYAFRELVINLLEIISGVIADVLGRKKAMVSAFSCYLLSFILFYLLSGFWGFMLAFLFYGVGDSFRTGTHKAMIHAYLVRKDWQSEKTRYYGMTRSWSQKGSAVSSLISACLVFYTGDYSLMFLMTTIPYLFDLLLLSSYPSYLNGDTSGSVKTVFKDFREHVIRLFKAIINKAALKAIVLTSGFTGYYKAIRDYIQIIITTLAGLHILSDSFTIEQNTAIYIGVIYFIIYLITSNASRNAYRVENFFKQATNGLGVLQISGYAFGIVAGLLFMMNYAIPALLLFSMILIIQNLRRPLAVKYITTQFDVKIMASVMSVESQSETLFASVLAFILGVVVDVAGLGWGITSLSVLLLVMSIAFRRIKV
ncbi:MFS transporter [Carboxylicivirga sp. RSCT41]|uniref:MFS transporter n=1 Tax=Carboxylicivirga agarovorans TaxID=3417570 RepID=UPI003D3383ED